jgi:tetratricopeptide (TPR) repeat protein
VSQRRPGRSYKIFVLGMSIFLILGTVGFAIGAVLDERSLGTPSQQQQDDERPGEEIARLQTAVAEDPDDTDSMIVLANILANSGRVDESIVWFERATADEPDNGELRLAFGLALFQLGNFFDAEIQLKRAEALLEDNATPAYYLGQLYERRPVPDLELAIAAYERALEAGPDTLVAQQAQARLDDLLDAAPTATP